MNERERLENVIPFLASPLTLVALALLLLLATVCAMIDISAIIFTLDQAAQNNRVYFRQILSFAVKNALRAWNPKNILLMVVVLLLMPLLNIGLASGILSTISIPEFIMDYIRANNVLSALLSAVILGITFLMMKWLYSFHYFTLEGCHFREARRRSAALSRKKRFKDFIFLLTVQLLVGLFILIFVLVVIALANGLSKLLSGIFVLRWLTSTMVWLTFVLTLTIFAALSTPMNYAIISGLYYYRKKVLGEEMLHTTAPTYTKSEKFIRQAKHMQIILGCGQFFLIRVQRRKSTVAF